MKAMIEWLGSVESRAQKIYELAAVRFAADARIAAFLKNLANDELSHAEFMQIAAQAADGAALAELPIALDTVTRESLETSFRRMEDLLSTGSPSLDQMLDWIVQMEFSEWNDLLVFVMNELQSRGPSFMRMVADIEQHRRYVTRVVETLPGGPARLEPYLRLPHVWKVRILIVEDAADIAHLLSGLCRSLASVTTAANGAEALRLLEQTHFDAIISDVDMPVMDGIQFFQAAVAADPSVRARLLFFSGPPSDRTARFFQQQHVRHIEKPAGISQIKQAVHDILERTHR